MTTRIINAVKSSGIMRERLFHTAYNSKKHYVMTGMFALDICSLDFLCAFMQFDPS